MTALISCRTSETSILTDNSLPIKRADFTEYRVNLWDTQGLANIHSVPSSQLKKADAIVLMYDVTCRNSFTMLPKWLKKIED